MRNSFRRGTVSNERQPLMRDRVERKNTQTTTLTHARTPAHAHKQPHQQLRSKKCVHAHPHGRHFPIMRVLLPAGKRQTLRIRNGFQEDVLLQCAIEFCPAEDRYRLVRRQVLKLVPAAHRLQVGATSPSIYNRCAPRPFV